MQGANGQYVRTNGAKNVKPMSPKVDKGPKTPLADFFNTLNLKLGFIECAVHAFSCQKGGMRSFIYQIPSV